MKKHILSFIFLLSLAFSVSAQLKETLKVDEFENPNCEDIKARLDTLYNALQNEAGSKAFIISYEGKHSSYDDKKRSFVFRLPKFGESSFINQTMMDYLFMARDLSKDRVLFVNGGFREKYTLEFWLVPRGAKSPEINSKQIKINYQKGKLLKLCGEY